MQFYGKYKTAKVYYKINWFKTFASKYMLQIKIIQMLKAPQYARIRISVQGGGASCVELTRIIKQKFQEYVGF